MVDLTRQPTLRVALMVGFGLTLGLWLVLGYQTARRLADAQREVSAVDARYVRAQETLSEVRSHVLLASVIVRDALLDTAPREASGDQQAIEDAYRAIDQALAGYVPVFGSSDELARLNGLKDGVAAFRRASSAILATDSRTWQVEGRLLLRRFLPSRERAVKVSEETQSINRALYIEQRRATAGRQAELQSQMWRGLGVALALSVVIGWLSFGHATRLERELREQYAKEARISADLQRLSGRLMNAQEEEQRRIARDLHDEVGQALGAVQLELTVAQNRLQRAGVADDVLEAASSATEGVLRNVRNLSQLLHPSALEDLGLSAALDSYVNAFSKRTGTVVDLLDNAPSLRFSAIAERTIYRVVQEALHNIVKHAHASRVIISVSQQGDRLVTVIEDDGVGFDAVDAERPGSRAGLGLLGMRERVAQAGGNMQLESVIGSGTRLEISVPAGTRASGAETDRSVSVAFMAKPEAQRG